MNETNMNRAKFYQLALFPMNNGATNVYFVLILSYVATFGENILGLVGFASIMVTLMRLFDAVNAARKAAIANGMSMETAMQTITDETVRN